MGLAKGGTRVDDYIFSCRERIGIYENGQVVVCGKGSFACCNGVAFPSDGQLARDLCDKVIIGGSAPKDEVAPGDIVTVKKGGMKLRLKVVSTVEKRVGAKTVSEYLEDLTPEEDYVTAREHREAMPKFNRSSSAPRPTRKERQAWEDFFAKVNE